MTYRVYIVYEKNHFFSLLKSNENETAEDREPATLTDDDGRSRLLTGWADLSMAAKNKQSTCISFIAGYCETKVCLMNGTWMCYT